MHVKESCDRVGGRRELSVISKSRKKSEDTEAAATRKRQGVRGSLLKREVDTSDRSLVHGKHDEEVVTYLLVNAPLNFETARRDL
jgi:hypothetical protein